MARQFACVLSAALLSVSAAAAYVGAPEAQREPDTRTAKEQRPQDPNRWKWWINPEHRQELQITDAQSAQIEKIFESSMPPQRANWREAEKLEAALAKTLKESVADVETVSRQVEWLEKLNAERRTMRAVMIYRMNLILTPDQRVKLEAFLKRRDQNRRRQPDRTEHRH
jgi:Spy/CpxP family protein refolding chaperone